jgi:hypothetical protein
MASARPHAFGESISARELGAGRNRTGDARLRTAALCPLSYSPVRDYAANGLLHLRGASISERREWCRHSPERHIRIAVMTKA